jgi:intein/homing endonuclease
MHQPQSVMAETELRHLTATPYQMVSPSSNSPIIGIYQDSLLGSYRFTRPNIKFTPQKAMNLLMMFPKVDTKAFQGKKEITNFEVLSQIMSPITLKYKTKLFEEGEEDYETSNNMLEIRNGKYIRGQIEKSVLASTTKGIIHRVCNDFGNMRAADFIDDLQNVVTEYMKSSSFSVGISDLIANKETQDSIIQAIAKQKYEVQTLIEKVHLGIFENNSANTNMMEFEGNVNKQLNKANEEAGKIGRKSLSKDNRFLMIVNSGSKGTLINISQMISCLGQTNVDGKRIPYGFDSRTLPHFNKFDDSPVARGFIENSYISGLTAPELFFHAMGGRIGLIDTACKTSQTGYIQRRLIKGLEDLRVEYDMTVRNNMGKIVQFSYGDDGFDSIRVENQIIPLVGMSIEDIYSHYDIAGINEQKTNLIEIYSKGTQTRLNRQKSDTKVKCQEFINIMIEYQEKIVKNVFQFKNENSVKVPVAFQNLIANIQGQMGLNSNSIIDITPLEAFQLIDEYFEKLNNMHYIQPNSLFKLLYYFYLTPKDLLINKRFHRAALVMLLETIVLKYKQAIVHPGEMVGVLAGQSLGEPTTQLSILRSESIKMVKINKTTKIPEMVSGEIGQICDNIITKLPEYTFDTGHKDSVETILETLDDEYYIIGVDEKEKTHWNKISHVSRHIVNGDMIRVKTKSGRIVTTTMSHSHLIRKDQTVQPIVGSDMTIGMRIPVAKHIDNSFVNNTIEIAGETYELDYLFGWFIGAYLAEDCLSKKKGTTEAIGTISISNISKYYIENVIQFAARFNRTCNINKKVSQILGSEKLYTNTDTSFAYKPLADIIMNTCGTGSFVKRVPDFAFLAPNEFKAGLLSGYFDGDGNFMCDKMHHQIRVCSRSQQLIKDISLLLSYFDIFGSLNTNYRNGANYYHLAISPKYSEIYQENIGTNLHKEKLKELVDYCERTNVHSLREDIDKINGLGEMIAKCGKTLELPGQSRNYGRWEKKDSIGRNTLQKYIEIFESHEKSSLIDYELSILRQAANSNVIWDEIVEIERYTPEQTEYVYDFTVPANQTFMTDYGVIVHNTLNSVTYDTHIMVRNSQKEIFKKKIGEFTEEQTKLSKKIDYMKDKDTTYAELSEYYEVPSATENGETVWRRIEAVTQHPVVNEDGTNTMLKVITKGNREVTATKAKSFLQLIDGKIQQVHGKDLKVGDYLPCSRKPLEYKETHILNTREILPPTEYIYGSELEKARKVVDEYQWWKKHSGKTFILPYNRSDSAYLVLNENSKQSDRKTNIYKDGFVYTKTNSICNYTIPENIPLDYDFGYLLGAYAAEGCMTKHQISIANNDIEYFKPIINWCEKHNITTKVYRNENKIQQGWTSQDVRIYSTVLCRILSNLCGNLSHNKYVSEKIVFSNKECILGFLDAYIGGDGCILRYNTTKDNDNKIYKYTGISMASVSYELLLDVQIMLKNLDIIGKINKPKKIESNNRGTLPENIHQGYELLVKNKQGQKLAALLNIKIKEKQEKCCELLKENFKYEYSLSETVIPNIIDGNLTMEQRNERMKDVEFDEIVSIEEVQNPTQYAYDLTVEDTRNFDLYNSICAAD